MLKFKWAIVALLALAGAAPAAAQQGTIMGQVLDRTSNEPLSGAQVFVVGTSRGALANQDGRYLIQGVPAGQQEVRATLIGYSTQTLQVVVPEGGTVTQNFELAESAIELGAVVVSATGKEQTLREIGSSVGVVNVDDVELAPVTSFSDLIAGRTAGAVVMGTSGTTGSGSRIRIRGSNSISLSNAPLLVIDGVRVESDPSTLSFGVGGQQPSALDDLNPENIESIEILKGPAASALYGTAAANGVIQVTTKKGQAGAPQFRVWAEGGLLERAADFPDNVEAVDDAGDICPLVYQSIGLCTPVQTYRANPLENSETTVFDGGSRTVYGASVSGGSDDATFYLSGERSDEESVYDSDNFLERVNLQANMTGAIGDNMRVRGTVGIVDTDAQFPLSDNALFGAVGMGVYGNATPESVEATGGYENPIEFHYDWQTFQTSTRVTSSAAIDYTPLKWLSINGSAGLEQINRQDEGRIPRVSSYGVFGGIYSDGWIQVQKFDITNINSNLSGSAVFDLSDALVSTTTVGTQYIREDSDATYAFGATLIPGIETSLAGATTDFSTGEGNVLNRVYLNAAVRGDQNTAFGTDIGWIWYPSVSGSWVISEENFFPTSDFLNEFRLRAAYGQAGLRPGATDALLSFSGGVGAFQNLDVPAITINEVGNQDLVPERSSEWEVGFEAGLLGGRAGLEATYYNKTSRDALVERPLAPSAGGSEDRWENLGEVGNSGFELLLSGEAVRSDNFNWNFTLSSSFNDNELVDLGEDAEGNPIPPIGSGSQRFVEGYALGGWWAIPIADFEDANNDGLIDPDEITVGVEDAEGVLVDDSVAFMGEALPTRELSLNTDMTFWNLFRVSALLDYKGGHKMLNYTRAWRCSDELNCEETYDPDTSLETQAAIVGRIVHGTYAGFFEDADFVKLRELALTFFVPDSWASAVRADNLRLTFAGRNLVTWSDYSGLDPEVSWQGAANFTSGDFATLPPNKVFTIRFDANF
jgi:TonB-linked SusC/RagA family outer membrane protein